MTVTQELQDASIKVLKDRYCRVIDTEEALEDIRKHVSLVHRPLVGGGAASALPKPA